MACMCGRFAVTTDPALLAEKIQAIDESVGASKGADKDLDDGGAGPNFNAPNYNAGLNYNVAPTTTISTVVKRHSEPDDESTRPVRSMRVTPPS